MAPIRPYSSALGALAIVVLLMLWSPTAAGADGGGDLAAARALLGGRTGIVAAVDTVEDRVFLLDLATGEVGRLSDDIACSYPEFSLDGARIVYGRAKDKELVVRPTAGGEPLRVFPGYHGRFWRDPQGEEWIYHSTHFATTTWPHTSGGSTTWRLRLRDGHKEKLLDWKTTAGPSLDGTHLGSDYLSVLLFDEKGEVAVLNENKRGCYASISPDNRYLLLHLDVAHDRMMVHDKQDRLVWQYLKPDETEIINQAHWSNDPDFAVFNAKEQNGNFSVFLVKLSAVDPQTGMPIPGQAAPLRVLDARAQSRSWLYPVLWIGADPPPIPQPRCEEAGCSCTAGRGGSGGGGGLLLVLLVVVAADLRRRRRRGTPVTRA